MISLDYLREMTSDKWIVLSTIANGVNLVKVHPNKFGNLESSVMKGQHNGTLKKKEHIFFLMWKEGSKLLITATYLYFNIYITCSFFF